MAIGKVCFLLFTALAVQSFAVEEESSATYTIGLLTQTSTQLSYFLQSSKAVSKVDISGHRFYKRIFNGVPVVMSYIGNGMINGAITTQLLLTSFPSITTVVNFGQSATPDVKEYWLGDIVMPAQLAHTGMWYWQNEDDSSNNGKASLTFGDYNTGNSSSGTNKLNKVWYQNSQVYYSFDNSESVFWVNASTSVTKPTVALESCAKVNGTTVCLPYKPKVYSADSGCSADVYITNGAYAKFLLSTFGCSTLDEDAAAVALTCLRNEIGFVTLRSISNFAGESIKDWAYWEVLRKLVGKNAVIAVEEVVSQLTTSSAISNLKIRKFFGRQGN